MEKENNKKSNNCKLGYLSAFVVVTGLTVITNIFLLIYCLIEKSGTESLVIICGTVLSVSFIVCSTVIFFIVQTTLRSWCKVEKEGELKSEVLNRLFPSK